MHQATHIDQYRLSQSSKKLNSSTNEDVHVPIIFTKITRNRIEATQTRQYMDKGCCFVTEDTTKPIKYPMNSGIITGVDASSNYHKQ
jgi:hypothetical protein